MKDWPTKKLTDSVRITDKVERRIKRGKDSWTFFYFVLGILLAVGLFFINILAINLCCKIMISIIMLAVLIHLCLFSAWFQNKLVGVKMRLEDTWKKL